MREALAGAQTHLAKSLDTAGSAGRSNDPTIVTTPMVYMR